MARLLEFEASRVYKWTYPRSRGGTDGLIPPPVVPRIQTLAELEKVTLTDSDWAPK